MNEKRRDLLKAFGLSVGAAVALGFSRFAYALLLPPMREALGWNYVAAGSVNTANAAGYVIGAATAAWFARTRGLARGFALGLTISTVVLFLTGATGNFHILMTLRVIGGVSTAFTFVLGASMAGWIGHDRSSSFASTSLSIYVAGAGVGVVLSGIAIPATLYGNVERWGEGWLVLGVIAAFGLAPAWLAARSIMVPPDRATVLLSLQEWRRLAPTIIAYGVFGAGYVSYMTFIIDLLRRRGGGGAEATLFWIVLGISSVLSIPLWSRVLGHMPGGQGTAAVFATSMLGSLLVLINPGAATAFASALLFGCSFLAAPAAVTIVAKRQLHGRSLTAGVALLTVTFALGQTLGPILSGAISDASGSVEKGLWLSPGLLCLASLVMLLQQREKCPTDDSGLVQSDDSPAQQSSRAAKES